MPFPTMGPWVDSAACGIILVGQHCQCLGVAIASGRKLS